MRFRFASSAVLFIALAAPLSAQNPFKAGTNYIGPSLGLSPYGAGGALVGNFEHAINDKWGWGVSGSYWSYSGGAYTIGGTAAYHFQTSNAQLDPFVAGFIGVFGCSGCHRAGGLFPGVNGGVRYWIKDNLALAGRVGWGAGILSVGVEFKM
ncbi:MAG TPA: hypothetical protein VHW65_02070 [Gemmatimonadales bacterium]|nr:hypothetical protein [Gemmatimonadales bacterium]